MPYGSDKLIVPARRTYQNGATKNNEMGKLYQVGGVVPECFFQKNCIVKRKSNLRTQYILIL